MVKALALVGLAINLAGVILLFRYGMPYRIQTKGKSYLLLNEPDMGAVREEARFRALGLLGLVMVVIGTGIVILIPTKFYVSNQCSSRNLIAVIIPSG